MAKQKTKERVVPIIAELQSGTVLVETLVGEDVYASRRSGTTRVEVPVRRVIQGVSTPAPSIIRP